MNFQPTILKIILQTNYLRITILETLWLAIFLYMPLMCNRKISLQNTCFGWLELYDEIALMLNDDAQDILTYD